MGGKSQSGVWQRIVNLIPRHRVYVEPFLGSGAIMRLKAPAKLSFGFDLTLHPETVATLHCRPGVSLFESCGLFALESLSRLGSWHPSDVLVYCDPPYVHATRSSAKYYRHEMTDADHVRLLRALHRLECRVILSGYPSALYASHGFTCTPPGLLPGWNVETFKVMTRGHSWRTECLWFNFERPAVPHDVSHVGDDHRERWRIEKRRRRLRRRFEAMNPAERAALFDVLSEVMSRLDPATPKAAPVDRA